MKKWIGLLLLLCKLLPAATYAEGARSPMLLLGLEEDFKNDERSFWFRHPEIKKRDCDYYAFDDWSTLILEKRPDLFAFNTGKVNFYKLRDTGALADLFASQLVREATARLRPDIKELVTTEDGQILAVPISASLWPLLWNQAAWDAAGYTEADVPQTYPEFLDFLEGWIARVTKKPVKNVCTTYAVPYAEIDLYRDVGWMIALLLETWEMQSIYAGEPLNFDTPEFIELLKRTRKVGLALFEAEPRMKKRENMMQLFTRDKGEQEGLDYCFSHTIPLRTSLDQPPLSYTWANMLAVHADSQWKDEALAFIEDRLQNRVPWDLPSELYTDFQPGSYELWNEVYTYTQGWLRDLDNFEGRFVFGPSRTNEMNYSAIKAFMEGEISAAQLVKKLNVPKLDPNT